MPTIFISYRRADSMEATGRIYDRLVARFGPESVFRDIDSIPLGVPFPELLRQSLARTNVVLVIIGPAWVSSSDEHGLRRLDKPADLVRMEIETALQLDVPVIPMVVSNAQFPNESELPESIRPLVRRNGFQVRPDPDFHHDMDRLCGAVQEVLGLPDSAVAKSDLVTKQLQELKVANDRLQVELELQQELAKIDRDWLDERSRHKRHWQSSPEVETAQGDTIFAVFGAFLLMIFVLTIVGVYGSAELLWVGIVIGIAWPGFLLFRLIYYQNVREQYALRKKAVLARFASRVSDSETSSSSERKST